MQVRRSLVVGLTIALANGCGDDGGPSTSGTPSAGNAASGEGGDVAIAAGGGDEMPSQGGQAASAGSQIGGDAGAGGVPECATSCDDDNACTLDAKTDEA